MRKRLIGKIETRWEWLTLGLFIVVAGTVFVAVVAQLLAQLPGGDTFILPLSRLSEQIGRVAHIPFGVLLSVCIVALWPLLIQWGIGQGTAVMDIRPPNLRLMFWVIGLCALGFMLFRTVNAPRVVDTVSTDAHTYYFRIQEFEGAPPIFSLLVCDAYGIICEDVLTPDDVNRSWNDRLRLRVTEDEEVRLLNRQTVVFRYSPG
jgi:hypothetical protein